MIKITTLGTEAFEADGVPYTRIFQPIKVGESSVAIIGIYDSSQMILGATTFDEIQVDGVIYVSQKDLMLALINVVSPLPEGVESGVYSVNGKIGAVVLTAPEVGAISEAPQDGKTYARSNVGWVELDAKTLGAISDAPQDGKTYARSNGGWVELDAKTQGDFYGELWQTESGTEDDGTTWIVRKSNRGYQEIQGYTPATSTTGILNVNYPSAFPFKSGSVPYLLPTPTEAVTAVVAIYYKRSASTNTYFQVNRLYTSGTAVAGSSLGFEWRATGFWK